MPTPATPSPRRHWGDWLIVSLLVFVPRLLNLDVFLTPDEPLFFQHALEFFQGMVTTDFRQTLGIGYPGVTVAAIAALPVGLNTDVFQAAVAGRVAVSLLNGTLVLILFGLARRLLGRWPALIGVSLLAIDPLFLGYSRLLHNDALLALFMALTGLSALLWLRDGQRRQIVYIGLFAGLALLTKSTALLLGPVLIVMIAGWAILTGNVQSGRWWRHVLLNMSAAAGVAVVVFVLLWPAMWVSPGAALSLTFGKLLTDQEAGTGNLGSYWMGQFVQDPGPAFYPVAFLLKSTPWLLAGLLLSIVQVVQSSLPKAQGSPDTEQKPSITDRHSRLYAISLWLFALTYLVFMTIASKKATRYLLPAIPILFLLAGLAYHRFSFYLARWGQLSKNYALRNTALVTLVVLSMVFTLAYHPYYLTYFNPAVLGWRWAPYAFLVGWGEGLDQAAAYLNTKGQTPVAAWYNHLFQFFYNGPAKDVAPENLLTADHAVLYISQVQRDIPNPNIIDYFRNRRQPEHTVRLNGIDYAWVYPGPIIGPAAASPPATPLSAQYASELQLLGYTLHLPNPARSVVLTLNWRVLTPPPAERFVFVRLLDAAGHLWAAADSPPVMGLWPVERWQPDTFIEDAQQLLIPAGTPPGTYRLEAGLYHPGDGQPLPATGLPVGPGGGLILGEVTLPWTPARQFDAPWPVTVNAPLSPHAALAGHTPLPATATTGDLLSLEMGWQNTESRLRWGNIWENNVVFEWRSPAGQRLAEQFEPLPLPIEQWGRGAVLRSRHDVIVPPTLNSGPVQLWAMLHDGSDPAGEAIRLAELDVTAPPHNFDLPAAATPPAGPAQLTEAGAGATVTLPGYTLAEHGDALNLQLFWQTDAPLPASYRVFAQLLGPDGALVAQSDALPAAGQRPTTGWLPGEIITDAHSLALPAAVPPGQYRLITGLYLPATGQRLPLAHGGGDAIIVAELSK